MEITEYEMQLRLNTIGYPMDYLDTLTNDKIISLYNDEFGYE